MGTPDFAAGILDVLLQSEYPVNAVFTQPDKPVGRKAILTPCPVKELALKAGIPVHQPKRIREQEYIDLVRSYAPDVIVVAAFGQILPKEILELPPYGCVNVHASLLPAWRGAAPIQWSVIEGDPVSGVTTMHMAEGLDTGDILEKVEVPLAEDETGGSLFDKLMHEGASLLLHTLKGLEEDRIVPVKQPEESTTPYAVMLTKDTGLIDFTKSAVSIERLIRGLDPWPSAWTYLNGKKLKIWKARVEESVHTDAAEAAPCGTVVKVSRDALYVQTGEGILVIENLQLEGKKRMDTAAFLRGFEVVEGTVLRKE